MKKPLKLSTSNFEPVAQVLSTINGRAESHTFTSLYELAEVADRAEAKLQALKLAAKERAGARVVAVSGAAVSKAYARVAFSRRATRVVLERRPSGWHIVLALPAEIREGGGWELLELLPEQKALAVSRFAATLATRSEIAA